MLTENYSRLVRCNINHQPPTASLIIRRAFIALSKGMRAKPARGCGSVLTPNAPQLFTAAIHSEHTIEESNYCRVDFHEIRMAHEMMRVIGDHQLFIRNARLLQPLHKVGCLTETHVAIVVAVNQKHRRLPTRDR